MRCLASLALLLLGGLTQEAKNPLPSEEAQGRAEKTIREIFKDEYAVKTSAAQQKLAKKLVDQGRETKDDDAARFILFREAADLSSRAGDVDTLLRAIDELHGAFQVAGLSLKEPYLVKAEPNLTRPEDQKRLAEVLLRLVPEALELDQLDVAARAAQAALASARKSKDVALVSRADAAGKSVPEMKIAFEKARKAEEILAAAPDDPNANQVWGEWLCFQKGRWDKGLAFLLKAPDSPLKALAKKEYAASPELESLVEVADGWWDLAEREKQPLRKTQLLAHARSIYLGALPKSAGLTRAKIGKRLEFDKDGPLKEGEDKATIDLLKLLDPGKDVLKGTWQAGANGKLTSTKGQALLQIPYVLPDEYDLKMVAVPTKGTEVYLSLILDRVPFDISVDGWAGTVTGIGNIDGKMADANETSRRGQFLKHDAPNTIVCMIRRSSITVTVNGERLIQWKPDSSRLTVHPLWVRPLTGAPAIGSWIPYSVTKLELIPVTGRGRTLR